MLGKPVPDFSLSSTCGTAFKLSSARGSKVVLYFYPQFRRAGALVYGVSRDSIASHERFQHKMKFPFELRADPDEAVCEQLGVMKLKNLYGKKVRGVPQGLRGVKVPGHAQEVLNFVKAL